MLHFIRLGGNKITSKPHFIYWSSQRWVVHQAFIDTKYMIIKQSIAFLSSYLRYITSLCLRYICPSVSVSQGGVQGLLCSQGQGVTILENKNYCNFGCFSNEFKNFSKNFKKVREIVEVNQTTEVVWCPALHFLISRPLSGYQARAKRGLFTN